MSARLTNRTCGKKSAISFTKNTRNVLRKQLTYVKKKWQKTSISNKFNSKKIGFVDVSFHFVNKLFKSSLFITILVQLRRTKLKKEPI